MCLNDQKFSHLHSLVVIVIISSKKREEIIELTAQEDGGRAAKRGCRWCWVPTWMYVSCVRLKQGEALCAIHSIKLWFHPGFIVSNKQHNQSLFTQTLMCCWCFSFISSDVFVSSFVFCFCSNSYRWGQNY